MSLDRQRIEAVKFLHSLGYSYSTESGWTVPPSATAIKAQFRNERATELLIQLGYHYSLDAGWSKESDEIAKLIAAGNKLSAAMAPIAAHVSAHKLPPIQMFCNKCGSTNVVSDALATWAVDLQRWELCDTLDQSTCNDCGADGWHDIKDAPAGDFADCQVCAYTYYRNHLTNGECKGCIDAKGTTP
jgi:hypothetical protein